MNSKFIFCFGYFFRFDVQDWGGMPAPRAEEEVYLQAAAQKNYPTIRGLNIAFQKSGKGKTRKWWAVCCNCKLYRQIEPLAEGAKVEDFRITHCDIKMQEDLPDHTHTENSRKSNSRPKYETQAASKGISSRGDVAATPASKSKGRGTSMNSSNVTSSSMFKANDKGKSKGSGNDVHMQDRSRYSF